MTKKIVFSAVFHRKSYKLAKKYSYFENDLAKSLALFEKDIFDKKLRTHKLSGELKDYWAFSCSQHNSDLRVIFRFDGDFFYLENIGTHADIY